MTGKKQPTGADLLLKMLKQIAEDKPVTVGRIKVEIDGNMEYGDHKNSFLAGAKTVQKVLPNVYDMLPDSACPSCFNMGALATIARHLAYMCHDSSETEPDMELRERAQEIVRDGFDAGFKDHLEWLSKQATKH